MFWNKSNKMVIFIGVQTGIYFKEDNTIKTKDDYGRI